MLNFLRWASLGSKTIREIICVKHKNPCVRVLRHLEAKFAVPSPAVTVLPFPRLHPGVMPPLSVCLVSAQRENLSSPTGDFVC